MNLFWANLITGICAVLILLYVVVSVINMKSRKARIKYIRNFKKGRFALIYLMAIPLYVVCAMYSGLPLHQALFKSLAATVNLVVLKYDYKIDGLLTLCSDSLFYNIILHVLFFLVAVSALLFSLSIFGQHFNYWLHDYKLKHTKNERLYIIGKNEENKTVYLSEKSRDKLIIGQFSNEVRDELYADKIFCHKLSPHENIAKKIVATLEKGAVKVVVNNETQEENLKYCELFKEELEKIKNNEELLNKIDIYVFGNPAYEDIYADIVMRSFGRLHYVNKYLQIAVDFVDRYPITSFLKPEHIDTKNALVSNNLDINVVFIGFGNTNRQIFLTSVANNQLLTKGENGLELKKVDYYIFDKIEGDNNKNLNHNYYRYKNEKPHLKQEDYLPFPEHPANEQFFVRDINSPKFYEEIKHVLTEKEKSVNVIIVACGSDLENIDIARKLCSKKLEWGIDNCVVFVKNNKQEFGKELFKGEECYFIGDLKKVFDIADITGDKFNVMAKLRNETYDLESLIKKNGGKALKEEDVNKSKEKSCKKWYQKKTIAERESSLYSCLSLRSKLHLLGLDYRLESEDGDAISEKEYLKKYALNDKPNTDYYKVEVDGKKIVKYGETFKDSTRKNLAILEHYRWNAFMITKGFIPASIDKITNETLVNKDGEEEHTNGKRYDLRRHGNLTTFEGLVEYSQILAKRDSKTISQTDVICYDYQLMDDALWLAEKSGLKIVKRPGFEEKEEDNSGVNNEGKMQN